MVKTNTPIPVLDKGFVQVHRLSGTDEEIVGIARVTTYKTAKKFRPLAELIRFLIEEEHSSPFGFPDLVFLVKAPKFVKEQWFRHRSGLFESGELVAVYEDQDEIASKYHEQQEFSGRYAEYEPEFYLPSEEHLLIQAKRNHQGSSEKKIKYPEVILGKMQGEQDAAYMFYQEYREAGLAKERARINLPFSIYVEYYWKASLWNVLDWLKKRRVPEAQIEIRAYADAIESVVAEAFPQTYRAWTEVVDGLRLTKTEMLEIWELLDTKLISPRLYEKFNRKLENIR